MIVVDAKNTTNVEAESFHRKQKKSDMKSFKSFFSYKVLLCKASAYFFFPFFFALFAKAKALSFVASYPRSCFERLFVESEQKEIM